MRKFTVSDGAKSFDIIGSDLPDAIDCNFELIAKQANIGSIAGYEIQQVEMEYINSVEKPHVELKIHWSNKGLPKRENNTKLFIGATFEDCPQKHVFHCLDCNDHDYLDELLMSFEF